MGLPGAGKTTAAKLLEDMTGATRLTSDEVRCQLWKKPTFDEAEHDALYNHLNDLTEKLLKQGKSVIYDANLNRYVHRQEKYRLANRLNIKTVLFWVQTPEPVALKRRIELSCHHHLVPSHETPKEMFKRISRAIEPPDNSERFIKINGGEPSAESTISSLQGALQ